MPPWISPATLIKSNSSRTRHPPRSSRSYSFPQALFRPDELRDNGYARQALQQLPTCRLVTRQHRSYCLTLSASYHHVRFHVQYSSENQTTVEIKTTVYVSRLNLCSESCGTTSASAQASSQAQPRPDWNPQLNGSVSIICSLAITTWARTIIRKERFKSSSRV